MQNINEPEIFKASFFGTLKLSCGDKEINPQTIKSKKVTKLLAILLYHHNGALPASVLMDMIWPGTSDDPGHALTNLIYRLRKVLAKEWPGKNLIISSNGNYKWNPEYKLETDAALFEALLEKAELTSDSNEKKLLLEEAVACGRGKFMGESVEEINLISLQMYFHNLFLKAVYRLIDIYEENHEFDALEQMCHDALVEDPYDEGLHCGLMKAYIGTNRYSIAESYYKDTVAKLQSINGGMQTEQMDLLYEKLQNRINTRETDLSRIMADMNEEEHLRESFFCEYGFFQKMFILEMRLKERDDIPVSIVLISLYTEQDEGLPDNTDKAMEQLKEVLMSQFRYGDMITKYSKSQYLLMLNNCSEEHAHTAMDRVIAVFYSMRKNKGMQLQYSIKPIRNR